MESNLFQKPVVTVGDNKTEPVNDKATTNTIELGRTESMSKETSTDHVRQ